MKFKYNGKIYNPVNVEKKLKKMGITMKDIEILQDEKKKEENSLEDYMLDKEQVIIRSKLDNIRRICYVPKGTRPDIKTLLGIQNIYNDYELNNMYYE